MKKRKTKPDSTDHVIIRIPASLNNLLSTSQHNLPRAEGNVSLAGDKLRIQAEQFRSFFAGAIDDILRHVEELVEVIPGPLKIILLVGGFSESPILQKAIKDRFGERFRIIIPLVPSLCVMKGAVLYGFNPSSVAYRRCRYTYGVETSLRFREGEHPPERRSGGGKEAFCDAIFDKHVEKDQEIPTNMALEERTYFPITNDDTLFQISLYRSSEKNPKFVDEQGCQRVGTFVTPVDTSVGRNSRERPIKVKMIFGASDIKVLTTQKNGKIKKADFKLNGMF